MSPDHYDLTVLYVAPLLTDLALPTMYASYQTGPDLELILADRGDTEVALLRSRCQS